MTDVFFAVSRIRVYMPTMFNFHFFLISFLSSRGQNKIDHLIVDKELFTLKQ